MEHPDPDVLQRFCLSTASREENRRVVRHLLTRCAACAASMHSSLWPQVAEELDDDLIGRAVRRVVAGLE